MTASAVAFANARPPSSDAGPRSIVHTVTGTGAARTGEGASTPPSDTMGAATNVSWYDDMSGDSI